MHLHPLWLAVTAIFVAERIVTVRSRGPAADGARRRAARRDELRLLPPGRPRESDLGRRPEHAKGVGDVPQRTLAERRAAPSRTLPFTGLDVVWFAVAAFALLMAAGALWRHRAPPAGVAVRTAARASCGRSRPHRGRAPRWVGATLVWGEPLTALRPPASRPGSGPSSRARSTPAAAALTKATIRERALAYRRELRDGDALGRDRRAAVSAFAPSWSRARPRRARPRPRPLPDHGPARLGGTVAIAGHRTTYLSPSATSTTSGLETASTSRCRTRPFGTSSTPIAIVDDRDWSILGRRPFEQLVLTACHPIYSASQRFVVFARLEATARPTDPGPTA